MAAIRARTSTNCANTIFNSDLISSVRLATFEESELANVYVLWPGSEEDYVVVEFEYAELATVFMSEFVEAWNATSDRGRPS